jgi:hypothetical protein
VLFVQPFFDNQWTTKDIQGNMSVDTKIKDKQKIIKKTKMKLYEGLFIRLSQNECQNNISLIYMSVSMALSVYFFKINIKDIVVV